MSKIIFTQSTPYAIEPSHIEVALPGNKRTASINSLVLRLAALLFGPFPFRFAGAALSSLAFTSEQNQLSTYLENHPSFSFL